MVQINTLMAVKNLLKASNYNFIDGDAAFQMFAEDVKRFSDDVVIKGAKAFIRNPGKFPNYPGLLDAIRTENNIRIEYSYTPEDYRKGVRCLKCNDNGYVFHYWKKALGDGQFQYTETMAACPCATGRARFPSMFETQKERDAWTMEKARNGSKPEKTLFHFNEEQFREAVGEEITESQYKAEFADRLRNAEKKPEKDVADLWKELANAI